jgi:hypothetical protein
MSADPGTEGALPPKGCAGVSAVLVCVGGAKPPPMFGCHRIIQLPGGLSLWRCTLDVCEGLFNTSVCVLGGTEPCPKVFGIGRLVTVYRCTKAVGPSLSLGGRLRARA